MPVFKQFKETITPIATAFTAHDFNLWVNYPFDFPKMRTESHAAVRFD
nr:MAG TPA: hypothetical protein [Caudoviricetes sp.]